MRVPLITTTRWQTPAWAKRLTTHMSQMERVTLAWLMVVLLVSGVFSIVGFIQRNTELLPESGGTYAEAAVGQPRYINPILAGANDLDVDITSLVYSSLFRLDSEFNLQNDLAANYEISADQTLYTVYLRQDVRWHDGEALNADDVVFTIRSIQTPDYGSPLSSAFQGVEVNKVDDHTVTFKLSQPYAPFLTSLTVGIVPEHVWSAITPKNAALAEQMLRPIGSGPYKFAELATRRKTGDITSLHLARNEQYYGNRPYIDEIVFSFVNSHEEALQALLTGNVDGVGFLPLQNKDRIDNHSKYNIHRLLLPQYFALFFNQQQSEILSDTGVRSALALGTDRETIVQEALQGEGESLHLPIPPGVFAYNDTLPTPNYDPEGAKQNLEEAGWTDENNDGIREKEGVELAVTITTTDWPEYIATAELTKQQWEKLGVRTEIHSVGAGTIQQTIVRPRDYEVLLFGEILSPDPDPYPFWHSTQTRSPGLNFALFKNQEVDQLLEEARKTIDPAERQEKYQQFQGKIFELNPAIILYRPYYLFAAKDNVHGVETNYGALPASRFNAIEQWHVRTKRVWKN